MYPSKVAIVAWLTMIVGLIKWGFAFVSIALVLIGLVKAALNGFRKQT
jgi:uncharacterized membrane protein YiaA